MEEDNTSSAAGRPNEAAPGGDGPEQGGDEMPPNQGGKDAARSLVRMQMPMRSPRGVGLVPSPAELLDQVARREVVELRERQHPDLPARAEPRPPNVVLLRPALPSSRGRRSRLAIISFLLMVALPIATAGCYYGLLAAPQYVSEFHFSVRSESATLPPSSGSSGSSIMASTQSGSAGIAPAGPDVLSNYIVVDYISSERAIADIEKKLPLRSYFTTKVADWWARLKPTATREDLLKYWSHMISATYDPATGIAAVNVRAFSPQAAENIAVALAANAEALVNRMEARARDDAVRFAQQMVDRDQKRLQTVEEKLLKLRQQSGVIDPTTSVVADNAQIVRQLETTLASLETQYAATKAQAPQAPGLATLREQIKATKAQLVATRAKIGATPTGSVLPSMVGAFEAATLDEQFVQQALNNDLATLQTARMNATSQSLYLMEEVPPNLPQSSTYPKRVQTVALIAVICCGIWIAVAMIFQSVRRRLI